MVFKMKSWNGYQKSPLEQKTKDEKPKKIKVKCYIKDGKKVCPNPFDENPFKPKEKEKEKKEEKPDTKN